MHRSTASLNNRSAYSITRQVPASWSWPREAAQRLVEPVVIIATSIIVILCLRLSYKCTSPVEAWHQAKRYTLVNVTLCKATEDHTRLASRLKAVSSTSTFVLLSFLVFILILDLFSISSSLSWSSSLSSCPPVVPAHAAVQLAILLHQPGIQPPVHRGSHPMHVLLLFVIGTAHLQRLYPSPHAQSLIPSLCFMICLCRQAQVCLSLSTRCSNLLLLIF